MLADFVDRYALRREITPDTVKSYLRVVSVYSRWLGREAQSADLNEDTFNRFLRDYQEMGRSCHYRRSLSSTLLALWRELARDGVVPPPTRVRKVKMQRLRPHAWTWQEVRRILFAAGMLPGRFQTLYERRGDYFQSLISVAWDTGLRRKDLHRLRRQDLNSWINQHKTGALAGVFLSELSIRLVGRLDPCREVLWPLWGTDESFRVTWRRILRMAGVPYGPFKQLRKSTGSDVERDFPGRGHEVLGNTRHVFQTYYLSPDVAGRPRPRPLDE